MNNAKLLLKYFAPYKWSALKSILYYIISAVFALFSFTLVVPFLKILFNQVGEISDPGEFRFSISYLEQYFRYFIDQFVQSRGQVGALLLVVIIVAVASLFKNSFVFLANNSIAYIRSCTVRDLRRKVYNKVLRLPLSFFTDSRKGDVMTRISNDVQEVEISVIMSLTMFFRDPMYILIFIVYLFVSSLELTLFAMVLLPLSGWMISRASRTLRSASLAGQQHLGSLLSIVEETLTGLRIIKGFNAEEKMKAQFNEQNVRYSKVFKRVLRKAFLASPMSEFLATVVVMVLLWVGGNLALSGSGSMTPEKLIAFLLVFSQIIQPAKNISTAYFTIQKGMASIDRIDYIIDAEEKIPEKSDAIPVRGFHDSIEFRNVSFGYTGESVLKNINLVIRKGQTVAIVGKSGSGKSTLADLLPRFMDVDSGSILVDGKDIRELKIRDLREILGIVSQQPILFNSSFSENIAFGVTTPVQSDIEEAARIANAHDFIVDSESGYNTSVGEGGSKLSGGQRQRISIARALLHNPPILILDEATSALDTESERLVQDAILKLMKNRTSIIIAHRLSTIQHADLIVVLEDGEVVETGTHADLIKNENGQYRKLYSYQTI